MTRTTGANGPRRHERGAALMVALVMIFVLSVTGVSVMRTASLESRMASNAIQSAITRQAAESATELMLNDPSTLSLAAGRFQEVVEVDTATVRAGIGLNDTSEIVYIGNGPAFGFSADFMTLRLVAQGDSSIGSVRSRSIIRQGARRVVPAPR